MGEEDVVADIVRRARQSSVVIINESHERSEHRSFTAELLSVLRAKGFTALALEALNNPEPGTPAKYYPSFIREPSLPYFRMRMVFILGKLRSAA